MQVWMQVQYKKKVKISHMQGFWNDHAFSPAVSHPGQFIAPDKRWGLVVGPDAVVDREDALNVILLKAFGSGLRDIRDRNHKGGWISWAGGWD